MMYLIANWLLPVTKLYKSELLILIVKDTYNTGALNIIIISIPQVSIGDIYKLK